ncbi:Asp/Glu/hydantoin racemase [Paucibacter sp. APW11]|uniref:Asp/Glu/hydantoin racemase n=1 Tax=Roseateles aquae TaxID=3077235 RepID=A0ABU3P6J9_9BURK|nr:Asp/Glu/hydantoin racemase [Paucibacter sp. APW11]MDT8998189.1 Asp/Glu/hydantoin racemase [Paucibacter sp. APW11]
MTMQATEPQAARLLLLHTAAVHIARFEALAQCLAPGLPLAHRVQPELLDLAREQGLGSVELQAGIDQALADARASGAAVLLCTCSTLGGLVEARAAAAMAEFPGLRALRVDRAMCELALAHGPRLLVVAALQSTLAPTLSLLQAVAEARGQVLQARTLLVSEAWACFEAGDEAGYLATLRVALRNALAGAGNDAVDAVLLAQASMATLADEDWPRPVLASPAPGLAAALALLESGL